MNWLRRITLSVVFVSLAGGSLMAGNDPNIKGKLRTDITASMEEFIQHNTVEGVFPIYDAVEGKLLNLKLAKLHSGIVKKADFYVSCADFKDEQGSKVDIDFMVIKDGDTLKTIQAIVHKTGGKKRPYHLEN